MSIFKKASDLEKIPTSISNALFDDHTLKLEDEFESLIREASANKAEYEKRVKSFKVAEKGHEFQKPEPALYTNGKEGIRRAGFGKRYNDESSELNPHDVRSTEHHQSKYAENLLANGLSIWDAEFDEVQSAFDESQKRHDQIFDRKVAAQKKLESHMQWEKEQSSQIRKSNVLPYRGLGITRLANEQPLHHDNFNSVDEFYAQAKDDLRDLVRKSNEERRTSISRQGISPEEKLEMWDVKEAIAARTMASLEKTSLITKFAEQLEEEIGITRK
jgi:hypothetical protein